VVIRDGDQHEQDDGGLTRSERRRVQALLQKLLPKARARAKELASKGTGFRVGSAVEAGLRGSLRIDNVYGVDVHQGPYGG